MGSYIISYGQKYKIKGEIRVMAEKELKKMNRTELIEIIYALQQREEALKEENAVLQEKLDDRIVKIENSGSIAEAVIVLNNIFQNAQDTADQYVESVRSAQAAAKEDTERIISEAQMKADRIVADAEMRQRSIVEQTEREIKEKWDVFDNKVDEILSAHFALRKLLDERANEGE